jgi:uncharacterized membrane protein YdjX (TVP38/TMEM64 family)
MSEGLTGSPTPPRGHMLSPSLQRGAALAFSVGLSVALFVFRDRIAQLSAYSYLGLFLVSLIGNATVLLPVPSLAATFIAGGIFNPLLAGLVSGAGMAAGELSGYLAGYGGTAIVRPSEYPTLLRIKHWMERHGFVTIAALAAIPNPIFDLAGVAAGMSRFPVQNFLLACFLGKTAKALVIAFLGARSLHILGWSVP